MNLVPPDLLRGDDLPMVTGSTGELESEPGSSDSTAGAVPLMLLGSGGRSGCLLLHSWLPSPESRVLEHVNPPCLSFLNCQVRVVMSRYMEVQVRLPAQTAPHSTCLLINHTGGWAVPTGVPNIQSRVSTG